MHQWFWHDEKSWIQQHALQAAEYAKTCCVHGWASQISNFLSYHTATCFMVIFIRLCFCLSCASSQSARAAAQISVCGWECWRTVRTDGTRGVRARWTMFIYAVPQYINFLSAVWRNVRREGLSQLIGGHALRFIPPKFTLLRNGKYLNVLRLKYSWETRWDFQFSFLPHAEWYWLCHLS
jgi:hypothetical protein